VKDARATVSTRPRTAAVAILVVTLVVVVTAGSASASASTWAVALHAGSEGQARAQAGPLAPTGVSATCVSVSQQKVTVTWGAITHASTYTVYDSTISSLGGFAVIASGVSGTTWTSATLSVGSYWFEVTAYVGSQWVSVISLSTSTRAISGTSPKCT
jgi:hypothetical protein